MKTVLESRSQRHFEKQLTKAANKRQHLLEQGALSLESGLGQLVIIVSGAPNYKVTEYTPQEQREFFLEEAKRLQEERAGDHEHVMIRPRAIVDDIRFDLANPHVTDMVLIGHGSIDTLWLDGNKKYFGWQDAVKAAKHLKQGKIEQRMCGNFPLDHNVPLGTFVVSRLTNVVAAPGVIVPDINPSDELFRSVYAADAVAAPAVVEQVAALNDIHAGRQPVAA